MGIIDIHTHMLYGVDDGAEDMEMSLALMGMDYEQGVRGIFCTNHSYDMEVYYREYHRRFEKLVKAAADRYPGLSLYKGCEILCYRDEMAENTLTFPLSSHLYMNRRQNWRGLPLRSFRALQDRSAR